MFLRRLGGWMPRFWGRRKDPLPESGTVREDSSPENSGSDWDSAPETMGDRGQLKAGNSRKQMDRGTSPEWNKNSSNYGNTDRLEDRRVSPKPSMDILDFDESRKLEARGVIPTVGSNSPKLEDSKERGVPLKWETNPFNSEAPVEKLRHHHRLLGWLQGETNRGLGAHPQFLGGSEEWLQISTNLTLHLLELLASALLGLCSKPLRLILDALGLRGPLGLWLHGLLSFLVTLHGLHLALTLLTAHPFHFACLFGLLQALVLAVSLRESTQVSGEEEYNWEGGKRDREKEDEIKRSGEGL
ncbi:uncharacterized protein C6orf47 homolog [Gracilinanus agilis]|uniref:uncharacterized protein C6orf47 homolog n=1 Tax=Gracilinanus agilis TaxID=191870 RepID=UPI001CFC97DC|nr:uncharacterized protein C6orf47 homolog [Gracilinanus agilis]